MPEENERTKVIRITNTRIKSLKVKSPGRKPLVIKNLTLKNFRYIKR
jgi:hypothetical protein